METLNLIIIEDEEAHFSLMKRVTTKNFPNASVRHFREANACLECLDEISPDIIITDYLMPGMNGIEFLKALNHEGWNIPVIMITGQGDENIAVHAMKLGAWDYIVKSADFFSLLPSVIEKVVREWKLEKALRESEEKFRTMFSESSIGIQLYDSEGRLLDANQSCLDIFGISDIQEIKGLKLFDNPNIPDDAKTKLKNFETVQYETTYDFELVKRLNLYKTTKSESIDIDVLIVQLGLKEKQNFNGYLVQVQDISERNRAKKHIHDLTRQVMKTQECERQRISRDLHDYVAQDLSTLKIGCEILFDNHPEICREIRQRVAELSKILQGSIMAVRNMSYNLHPPGLDQLGLDRTILEYCQSFSDKNDVMVECHSAGMDDVRLDFDTEINLYRVIQEALNNIKKHANAGHVTVRLIASFPSIILRIDDDGKGFEVKNRLMTALNEKRMGLRSIKERVGLLNGKIRIQSRLMEGTKIFIEVPYKEKKRDSEKNYTDR